MNAHIYTSRLTHSRLGDVLSRLSVLLGHWIRKCCQVACRPNRRASCALCQGNPSEGHIILQPEPTEYKNLNHCVASSAFCYNLRFMGDILQFTWSQKHFGRVCFCTCVRVCECLTQSKMANINYTVMCSYCDTVYCLCRCSSLCPSSASRHKMLPAP